MSKRPSQKNISLAEFVNTLPQNLLPISTYSKNKEGIYTDVNDYTVNCANFTNVKDFLDKCDTDMPWHNQADSIRQNDIEVMTTEKAKCTVDTITIVKDTWSSYLSIKMPTYDNDKVVNGIQGISLHINMLHPALLTSLLSNIDKSTQENIHTTLRTHALEITLPNDTLTIREKECLLHLARGRTSREISLILGLSRRTVECHIDNAKMKLGCNKKSQLIDRIFEHFPHFWLF